MNIKRGDSEDFVRRMANTSNEAARRVTERYARADERTQVGLRIDPKTALVFFDHAQIMDPYCDVPELPDECYCVGRVFFAVDPDERIAVCFYDLPETTRAAFGEKEAAVDREVWRVLLGLP